METCHYALVRGDMALGAATTLVPRGLNHVFLFELGSVRDRTSSTSAS
jgi:hypothetical protein